MSPSNLSPFVINWFVDKQTIPRIPCLIVTCRHLWRIGLSATFPSFFLLVLALSSFVPCFPHQSSSLMFSSQTFAVSVCLIGALALFAFLSFSISVCLIRSFFMSVFPTLVCPFHFHLSMSRWCCGISISVSVCLSGALRMSVFLSLPESVSFLS